MRIIKEHVWTFGFLLLLGLTTGTVWAASPNDLVQNKSPKTEKASKIERPESTASSSPAAVSSRFLNASPSSILVRNTSYQSQEALPETSAGVGQSVASGSTGQAANLLGADSRIMACRVGGHEEKLTPEECKERHGIMIQTPEVPSIRTKPYRR